MKHEKIATLELCKANRPAIGIAKLDLENVGRKHLDNRSYLPARKPWRLPVIKQSHDVEKFGRCLLHTGFHNT